MSKHLFIIVMCLMIISTSIVIATEERYSFIIDQQGNTKLRYQVVLSVDEYGMYLPGFDMTFTPPEEAPNLEFFDSSGKITPKFLGTEEGFAIYEKYVPDIEYNDPYQIGYQYDLPQYTTVRYNENYHFEYPLSLERNSTYVVSVCIPSSADTFPETYDSTPSTYEYNDWNSYKPIEIKPITPITPITYTTTYYKGDSSIDVCPSGYKKTYNYDFEYGVSNEITSSFSMSQNKLGLFTYEIGKIKIIAPEIYKSSLERSIQKIESAIPNIESKLNLNTPSNYVIYIVSDTDKVFTDTQNGNSASVSQEDGTVYFKVSLMNVGDDEFIQVNLLRAIINTALLKTYGENSDNSWWSHGALTNMAVKLMKESGLSYTDVQKAMNDVKDGIKLMTTNEIIEVMTTVDSQGQILIYSTIVDEIDSVCPDHVIKLNKNTKSMSNLAFSGDKQFNNFLLYNLKQDCSQDIGKVLDKYQFEHDNVGYILDKYNKINEKFQNIKISRNDIQDLNTAKSDLIQADSYLKQGKASEALTLVEKSEEAYARILDLVTIYSKIEELKPRLIAIPEELRSPSVLSAINKIDEAEDLATKQNTKDALTKINEASVLYDESVKKMGGILQEYVDAKIKVDSIPGIFYLPAKPLAKSSLNSAVTSIKSDSYDSARGSIGTSHFWSNNAIIVSLIFYALIISGAIFGYIKFIKPKQKEKPHKPKHYQHQ